MSAGVFWYYRKGARTAHVWKPFPEVCEVGQRPMWRAMCGQIYISEREYINRVHLYTDANTKVSQCKHCLRGVSK